ncbi:MAG: FlgB family protein [Rhodobacteraceae bacterium]|nr:FlgB family protein [Paracoccaceae bacterium]
MTQTVNVFQLASQLAAHATKRQSLIALNVANADTPGYKARDLTPFADSFNSDSTMSLRTTRPGHLQSSFQPQNAEVVTESNFGAESPNGNSVSLEDQMVRASEVRMQHDLAMGIYAKSLQILRTSMGRS